MLDHLGLVPRIDLSMRLGEGSGAALGISLAEASARLLCEMATFTGAGISDRADTDESDFRGTGSRTADTRRGEPGGAASRGKK